MMPYQITRQYARAAEMPLAEFNTLNDARFFLKVKLTADSELRITAIYRLFQNGELLNEINRGKINVSGVAARYFEEDIPSVHPNDCFQVVEQHLIHAPQENAYFLELKDAELFIQNKLEDNLTAHKKILYRILKAQQLVEKFEPMLPSPVEHGTDRTQSGAANRTRRPTPFNTTPRPAGSPQRWMIEPVQEEKEGEE